MQQPGYQGKCTQRQAHPWEDLPYWEVLEREIQSQGRRAGGQREQSLPTEDWDKETGLVEFKVD